MSIFISSNEASYFAKQDIHPKKLHFLRSETIKPSNCRLPSLIQRAENISQKACIRFMLFLFPNR